MREKSYSISEASKMLKVENHVLRYWEEELDLAIPRNELGHRFYRQEDIQVLYCVKELKNKGFQLKAVKEVLPDLKEKNMIDVHKLLITQEELELMENQELGCGTGNIRPDMETGIETNIETDMETGMEADRDLDSYGNIEGKSILKVVNLRKQEGKKGTDLLSMQKEPLQSKTVPMRGEVSSLRNNEEKMQEFEAIMGRIIGRALQEQAENMGDIMGDRICGKVAREIDEVFEEQEDRAEARFRKLDETIRSTQKARQEIAVAKDEGGKKKSLFFRKNKRKI